MEEPVQTSEQIKSSDASQGTGLDSNVAAALSYVFGFITGIIFLLIEKEDRFVRFHAMQSVITFGGLFIVSLVINVIPILGQLISILLFPVGLILWILLIVKAYKGEEWEVPVFGKIAREQAQKM